MRIDSLVDPRTVTAPHAAWDEPRVAKMMAELEKGGVLALPPVVGFQLADGTYQAITGSHRIVAYKRLGCQMPLHVVSEDLVDDCARRHGVMGGFSCVSDFAAFAGLLANDHPELSDVLTEQEETFVGREKPEHLPTFTSCQELNSSPDYVQQGDGVEVLPSYITNPRDFRGLMDGHGSPEIKNARVGKTGKVIGEDIKICWVDLGEGKPVPIFREDLRHCPKESNLPLRNI